MSVPHLRGGPLVAVRPPHVLCRALAQTTNRARGSETRRGEEALALLVRVPDPRAQLPAREVGDRREHARAVSAAPEVLVHHQLIHLRRALSVRPGLAAGGIVINTGTTIITFLMVFLILAAQYEKWSLPLGVLLAVLAAVAVYLDLKPAKRG